MKPEEPLFHKGYVDFVFEAEPGRGIHYTSSSSTKERQERHDIVKRLLLDHWSTSNTLLDIGCGNGDFIMEWCGSFWHDGNMFREGCCFGVDIGKRPGMRRKEQMAISIAERLPFSDQSFDLATSICVLEHLESPIASLREIYRVVRYGAVIVTPNLARPSRWWGKANDLRGHHQGYDIPLLTQVVESVGFKVRKVEVRFVDCPGFKWWPKLGKWLSYGWLKRWFPQLGSEIYVVCTKG